MSGPGALCSNEDHYEQDGQSVPARFDVTFPTGRWNDCLACDDCIEIIVENLLAEPTPIVIVPVGRTP